MKNFRNAQSFKVLYYSYVRSKIEYASIVWFPFYRCHIATIESVQRKFLKFLYFKEYGSYPERGFSHDVLLNTFDVTLLEVRRVISSCTLIYKILHNELDCCDLLHALNFHVPQYSARRVADFVLPLARTNIMLRSPLYVMCSNLNKIGMFCDIHSVDVKQLRFFIVEYQHLF